jgi:hypothetical protein
MEHSEGSYSEARTLFLSTSSTSFGVFDRWILFNIVPAVAGLMRTCCHCRSREEDHGDDGHFVVNVGTTLKTHITRSLLQSMRVWIAAAVGTGS